MKKTDLEKMKAMKLTGRLKQDQALRGKKAGGEGGGARPRSRLLSAMLTAGEVTPNAAAPADEK